MNRILTKGFGPSSGLAGRAGPTTMGYGGIELPPLPVPQQPDRQRTHNGTSTQRKELKLDDIVKVWAKLIEINSMPPKRIISGSVSVSLSDTKNYTLKTEGYPRRIKNVLDRIHITARRIRKR